MSHEKERSIGLAGLLALGLGLTTPALAQQAVLTLADRRLSPGATLSLTGAQFPPASRLALALEGAGGRAVLGSVTAGPDGAFSESVRVPGNLPPGAYRLVARAGPAIAGLDVAVLADTAAAPARAEVTVFGYDWPRLHAALNDLPAALLLVSVLFDLVGAIRKREDFRIVGFWTLMVGVLGTGAAVIAGLKAEASVEHSDEAHAVMEVHQTMGLIVLGVFGILALWRLARRRTQSPAEQTVAALVGLVGLGVLVRTAQLGGTLMFEHALGIPTARLHVLEGQRETEEHEHGAEPASHPMLHADSLVHAHADSIKHPHE